MSNVVFFAWSNMLVSSHSIVYGPTISNSKDLITNRFPSGGKHLHGDVRGASTQDGYTPTLNLETLC